MRIARKDSEKENKVIKKQNSDILSEDMKIFDCEMSDWQRKLRVLLTAIQIVQRSSSA